MANLIRYFFAPEDETAFFRRLAREVLEIYPVRIPPNWKPFRADEKVLAQLPEEAMYLAATDLGPVLVDKVKRGPDRGLWRVDEVRSPVIFYERSRPNESGELVSGKIWAELDVTPQTGRRTAAPDHLRQLFAGLEEWFRKTCRKGEPKGFLIGPEAARQYKAGLVLRDSEHRGGTVRPYR